ncbi:hypothetical protein D3C81_973200 [compost metagenome]
MPLVGQGHALGVAAEQADADFLLQLLDGQGQGRLGNERGLCGGGDRTGLGHSDEMADLTQGHHGGRHPVGCFYRFVGVYIFFFDGQRQVPWRCNIWKHSRARGVGTFDLGWCP